MFNTLLPNATDAEFAAVAEIQKDLRNQQARLDQLLESGVVDETELDRATTSEADWAFRRCARILGSDRFELLFGIDLPHAARTYEASLEASLLGRYKTTRSERQQVVAALEVVDPQASVTAKQLPWTGRSKYREVLGAILKAEHSFNIGDTEDSLAYALVAIEQVAEQSTLGDAGLYLVAWARHIEGRSYEALTHWESAAICYESSLSLKIQLGNWLPPAALLATEVKLGGVEILQSPVQAATRLRHVVDILETRGDAFKQTPALYENLREDSRLTSPGLLRYRERAACY